MRATSSAPAGSRTAVPLSIGSGSWPGTQRTSTCSGVGDGLGGAGAALSEITVLRTIDGVPGSRSTARTHRASVVPVASVLRVLHPVRRDGEFGGHPQRYIGRAHR